MMDSIFMLRKDFGKQNELLQLVSAVIHLGVIFSWT